MKFNPSSLAASVVASLGVSLSLAGLSLPAHAVHISPNGMGQALIYPYYTVNAPDGSTARFDTYISVTNSTNTTKALRLRVMEGKRGAEVLWFNLYLGAYDSWAGAVVATASGARLVSTDASCTVPANLFTNAGSPNSQLTPNTFKNFLYAGEATGTLDRGREGHIEILEMGVVTEASLIAAIESFNDPRQSACALVEARDVDIQNPLGSSVQPPTGGLYGGASLINPLAGVDYSYDAIALDNWYDARSGNIWRRTATDTPNLTSGGSLVSEVFTHSGDKISSTWPNSRDAISAVMMRESVINDFVLDAATRSGTSWIVTMPTKQYHVQPTISNSLPALPPFNLNFNTQSLTACEAANYALFDREKNSLVASKNPLSLCFQTNVINYGGSQILGSSNASKVVLPQLTAARQDFPNGWMSLTFDGSNNVIFPLSSTLNGATVNAMPHRGLPVVGLMVRDFTNGNVATSGVNSVLSAYGGQFVHKYRTKIGG